MINVITSLWSPVWVCSNHKVVCYVTCQPNGKENNNNINNKYLIYKISNLIATTLLETPNKTNKDHDHKYELILSWHFSKLVSKWRNCNLMQKMRKYLKHSQHKLYPAKALSCLLKI